jgi:hypothetical protein
MHRIWVDGTEFRWTREAAVAADPLCDDARGAKQPLWPRAAKAWRDTHPHARSIESVGRALLANAHQVWLGGTQSPTPLRPA